MDTFIREQKFSKKHTDCCYYEGRISPSVVHIKCWDGGRYLILRFTL